MNFTAVIEELKSLSENGIYKRDKIEWWLLKYNEVYKDYYCDEESRFLSPTTYRADSSPQWKEEVDLLNKVNVFLDTYELMNKVSDFYKKELYFKKELELFRTIKNDVKQLNSWLELHELNKDKTYKDFDSLFQNTKTLSGYWFELYEPFSSPIEIKLEESAFMYTLQFLRIIEKAKKVQIIGTVTIINDLEVVTRNNSQTFERQNIVVSIKDGNCTELLIWFNHERVQLLKNLKVGEKVKIYTELIGHKDESEKTGYFLCLIGWDLEILKN